MRYHQVHVISGKGPAPHQFAKALRGIGADRKDVVYAVGDTEVKVFTGKGDLLARWKTSRPGYCVAVTDDDHVYVGQEGQIERFDSKGKLLAAWQDKDRFGLVTEIGFWKESVLIADAKDRCLRRYDESGKWINDIGKKNNTRGFLIPNGHLDFDIDPEGIVHVSNPAKHRVERYNLGGELLGHWGKFGGRRPEDFPGCCNPTNLALTPEGNIVVTEKAGPRLKVYNSDGELLSLVTTAVFDVNCKNMDVAVDSRGRIYVADTVNLKISVFAPVTDTRPATTRPEVEP